MRIGEVKRTEAVERQSKHDSLSIQEKIDKLDKRLGKGVGARKERARLLRLKEVSNG